MHPGGDSGLAEFAMDDVGRDTGPAPERLKPPLGQRQAPSRLAELAERGFNSNRGNAREAVTTYTPSPTQFVGEGGGVFDAG